MIELNIRTYTTAENITGDQIRELRDSTNDGELHRACTIALSGVMWARARCAEVLYEQECAEEAEVVL